MMKKKKGLKNYFISELAAAFIIEAEPLQKYLENRAAITENWVGIPCILNALKSEKSAICWSRIEWTFVKNFEYSG